MIKPSTWKRLGGDNQVAMAARFKVTKQAISHWKVRGVPHDRCAEVERETGVLVRHLRDDWKRIWPSGRANPPKKQSRG